MWLYATLMFVALVLSLVYGLTLVPTVTWAHQAGDSGDLLTAVATGGVPHPTGYPSYLLLVDAFRWLPWGDLALQQALFSALCAIATALLVVLLVNALTPVQGWRAAFAGGFAALWLGFTPLFWSQAVVVEVYSLHALFTALLWWWAVVLTPTPTLRKEFRSARPAWRVVLAQQWATPRLAGLTAGLALGNHLTVAASVAALLLLLVWRYFAQRLSRGRNASDGSHPPTPLRQALVRQALVRQALVRQALVRQALVRQAHQPGIASPAPQESGRRDEDAWCCNGWAPLAIFLLWLALGLTVYLLLPLRAGATPASWGDPRSLEEFFWLVSGQLYHHMALQPPEQPLTYAFDLLRAQLGLLGLGMALWGLLAVPVRLRAIRPVMLLVALVTLTFAVSYRSHDAQVYLLPVLLIGAVGVGLAVGWGLDVRRRREGIRGYGDVMRRGCEDAGDALFDPHPLAPSPTTWERGRRYWDAWCSNAVFARQRTRFLSVVKPPFRLPASRIILALLLLLLIILRLASPWPAMRAARSDQRAAQFSAALLAQAPHGAIIFTREDRDSFPLWYAHYGRDQRPDLTLVVAPLLTYDWYRANLRRHYPDLVLPHGLGSGWDMALIAQNPTRTPCWSLLDQAEVLWCQ